MKRAMFIFDRVAHYHRDLFKALETALHAAGVELVLLSGAASHGATGRVGLSEPVIAQEFKYTFKEHFVGSFTFRRAIGVNALIERLRPDIVVCMGHVGNISHWQLLRLRRTYGYKLVVWQCGYEYNPGRAKALLLRNFVPKFDHHLAYHSNARAYVIQHGARPEQVTLMHNTIDESRIVLIPKTEARRLLNLRHPEIAGRKILLFVGAVLVEKRIETILSALGLMKRPDIVFVLVGDGNHLPAIKAICSDRNDVVLTGSIIDGVGLYFDAAEVYLLPGTGGLGINEAMAHRLPVIAGFADGSTDDLVIDGENGYRLRDGSASELAERLQRLLDTPGLAEKMGAIGRQRITGKFAFKEFIRRITDSVVALTLHPTPSGHISQEVHARD